MFSDGEYGAVFNGNVALYELNKQPPSELLLFKNYKGGYSVLPAN